MTLRALALAAVLGASLAPAAHAACLVGTLVCTQQRPVTSTIYGPTCVYGSIGASGHYQTYTC